MKFTKQELMDFVITGIKAVAGGMIEKALAPVTQRLAALETENKHLREAVAELRADDTPPEQIAAEMQRRYARIQ
ncbi:hypothetical protein [Roseomonas fluvialis]|uniref:Uncharacterized protein n=1 Tax=Roseomonas fluvialis TaxID=1750527 RepID=A0ABN6P0I1_9PROT|nr:hypothetical protein [Roseomonas fluvialis]BDG71981.1 hypothetical protein Rmf_19100 [Roseomonas fluvialis]